MGATSSQLIPSQSQDTTHTPNDSQEGPAALEGAMDDPAPRDDVIHVKQKRTSTDALRPLKRSRKERVSSDLESSQFEVADSQDATGKAQEPATEESAQKPRKKKAKKQHAVGGDGIGVPATQDTMISEQTPMSTADSMDGSKRVKTKRKRAKGRPSGLNIFPAGMSDPLTQESAIVGADRSTVVESPAEAEASLQNKPTKPANAGHLSPEMTNAQSSQQAIQKTKSPKVKKIKAKKAMENGTSPAVNESPKVSKKRAAEVEEDTEMLPTPPEASQVHTSKIGHASKQPENDQEGDEGALRDDYSEVDATRQVEGWLSSQLDEDNLTATPRLDPPASSLRKKAAANASAKREKAQRSEEQKSAKKRRRSSQYLEDDSDDYAPEAEEQRDTVVTETPGSTVRRSKKRANHETDDAAIDVPTQDTASPLVSKKARRAKDKTQKSAKKAVVDDEQPDAAPSTPANGSTKRKRKAKPTTDDEDQEESEELPVKNKKSKSTQKEGPLRRVAAQNAERSRKGPLTAQEKAMVDNVFDETVKETGMTEDGLRTLIKTWRQATDFKEAVEHALPDRPLAAIRKFCQRRYHNMERGAWSSEDDTNLKNAYAAHPDKWTEISALVGRTGSDCKDRWKNTVSIQDTMQLGPWSQDETVALTKAVDQSIKELKKANKEAKGLSRAELERMLSWAEVAKKLGGTRSAKRCNEKWQKIKRDAAAGRQSMPAQPLSNGLDFATSSKKLRAIEKAYNQCDIGDLYDILTEIHTALPDPNQQFDYESTMWAIVATKNPGSRFSSAMRRRGLHDAADVYKAEVAEQSTISGRAKALAGYLENQWGIEALAGKRAFISLAAANKFKSAERVDSDQEDGSDADEKQVDTETPPTSHEDDDVDDNDEDASDQSAEVEVPDSQPQPAANKKHSKEDFDFSFKPINKKQRKEPTSPPAEEEDSDVVERLPSSVKRKKSSKKAKARA
jgi:hypothetical protein